MAIALDAVDNGTGGSSPTTATSGSLTTTGTNRVLVAMVSAYPGSGGVTVTGITDTAGLTWIKRKAIAPLSLPLWGDQVSAELWYAVASSVVTSLTVTATFSATASLGEITVSAWSGVNTTTPWDTNASLTKTGTSTTNTTPSLTGISTTAANTVLLAMMAPTLSAPLPPAGWTTIDTTGLSAQDNAYKIVSAAQSSITVSFGATDGAHGWLMLVDALQQATAFVYTPIYSHAPIMIWDH